MREHRSLAPRGTDSDLAALLAGLNKLIEDARSAAERNKSANPQIQSFARKLAEAGRSLGGEPEPVDENQVDWAKFGKVLRAHRKAADLAQKELASMLGVSTSYFRMFENGTRKPPIKVLMRILSCPSLGITFEDLAAPAAGVHPFLWLAPQYDPREMLADLCDRLAGAGCSLEQTYAYLDTQSASDFLALCRLPTYGVAPERSQPFDQIAKTLAASVDCEWLDVVALGCGDAKQECMLVQDIVRHARGRFKVRLLLLDISHALLTEGYKHACSVLQSVTIVALQGNFHEIAQYPIFSEHGRARVLTMLGNTLANLENEVRFFRDNLAGASLGDYFLLDFTSAFAPPEQPDDIYRLDPALEGIRDIHKTWLTGNFYRYCREMKSVDIEVELNTDCIVKGSYELVYIANIHLKDSHGPPKRFVVQRVRRYDSQLLSAGLRRNGWGTVKQLPFGEQGSNRLQLMLLRREAAEPATSTRMLVSSDGARHRLALAPNCVASPNNAASPAGTF